MSRALTVSYRGSVRPQVQEASFSISEGITALIGRNGAGKTTLLKAAVGLVKPSSGDLVVLGDPVSEHRIRAGTLAKIGYLPQEFGFVSSFTTEEFVEYGGWLKGLSRDRIKPAALAAMEVVGLADNRKTRIGRLSGGMRRRAGIAYAIVHGPDLLILDEPTTGLDPEQRVRFRALLRSLSMDRGVILSSHLVEDVKAVASHVLVLDDGILAFDGSVTELETRGADSGQGDSALERGYMAVLASRSAAR